MRVRLRRGDVEIEVESPVDRVSEVVARIVEGLARTPRREVPPQPPARPVGGVTCRGLIESLWMDGWFSEPRGLSEVAAELSRRGYNYDSTAISHALTDLVRAGVLSRIGTPRTYRYVQKRPPD
ncbi:MAG: hypothetical protein ACP5NG_01360 [Conexivisphaera sp.]